MNDFDNPAEVSPELQVSAADDEPDEDEEEAKGDAGDADEEDKGDGDKSAEESAGEDGEGEDEAGGESDGEAEEEGGGAADFSDIPDLPEAVPTLMEAVDQCSVFAEWIEKARAKQAQFSSNIVEKVITDYLEKYQDVVRDMQPPIQEIQGVLEEEKDAPTAIEEDLSKKELEREELALRSLIGELDDAEFSEIDGVLDAEISELREQIDSMSQRRNALDGVLQAALATHRLLEECGGTLPDEAQLTGVEVQVIGDPRTVDPDQVMPQNAEDNELVSAVDGDEDSVAGDDEAVEAVGETGDVAEEDDELSRDSSEEVSEEASFSGDPDSDPDISEAVEAGPETIKAPELGDQTPEVDDEPPVHSTAEWQESLGGGEATPPDGKASMTMSPKQGPPVDYPITNETLSIGRGRNNDIQIKNDGKVSRYHCRVICKGGEYIIEDNKSSNGTIVNGRAIARKKLTGGEKVVIGETSLVFNVE